MTKKFALTGVAGYIAPRHLKAIKETGNSLLVAMDKHDSVGILDRFFPKADFFTEIERFDRYLEKVRRNNNGEVIDYMSVCSPNHLHDAHIRLGMRVGADIICEKPLVLNSWNLDSLQDLEREYDKRIWNVLQLRLHPAFVTLKKSVSSYEHRSKVKLTYITSRGPWYNYSWKSDISKSGGLASNIGIHFFDILIWLFGSCKKVELYLDKSDKIGGYLELQNADVEWYLSIDSNDLLRVPNNNQATFREITVDEESVEFSGGFTDLHTTIYEKVIEGIGFGIEEARPSIEVVENIRQMGVTQKPSGLVHPIIQSIINKLQ